MVSKQLIKYFQDALDEYYGFVYDEDKIKVTIKELVSYIIPTVTILVFGAKINTFYYMERRELDLKDFIKVINNDKERILEQCIKHYDKHIEVNK